MGRIHLGRQDLDELQTRKMKGLKRGRGADADDGENTAAGDMDMVSDDESIEVDDEENGVIIKRPRVG